MIEKPRHTANCNNPRDGISIAFASFVDAAIGFFTFGYRIGLWRQHMSLLIARDRMKKEIKHEKLEYD